MIQSDHLARKRMRRRRGSQPAHKLQTRPPGKGPRCAKFLCRIWYLCWNLTALRNCGPTQNQSLNQSMNREEFAKLIQSAARIPGPLPAQLFRIGKFVRCSFGNFAQVDRLSACCPTTNCRTHQRVSLFANLTTSIVAGLSSPLIWPPVLSHFTFSKSPGFQLLLIAVSVGP
jgi:hypothetical protein